MSPGRPSTFTQEIADAILDRLASGESMSKICTGKGMPHRITVIRWMGSNPEFATRCARAREIQADVMDDRILEVADNVLKGKVDSQSAKVAISAFQWRASKLAPKVYGDLQKLEHSGADGKPFSITVTRITPK